MIRLNDERLALLAQKGDREAEAALMNRYKPLVRSVCQRYYMVGATKEDVVQEGMIGLFRAIASYQRSKNDSFAAFAALCIRRRVMAALSSARRKKHLPLNSSVSLNKPVPGDEEGRTLEDLLQAPTVDPEEIYLSEERLGTVFKALDRQLSTLEKRVLVLFLKGCSYECIAQKIGITRKGVDNALQRIRHKMNGI